MQTLLLTDPQVTLFDHVTFFVFCVSTGVATTLGPAILVEKLNKLQGKGTNLKLNKFYLNNPFVLMLLEFDSISWGYIIDSLSKCESDMIKSMTRGRRAGAYMIAAYEEFKPQIINRHTKIRSPENYQVPVWLHYAELVGDNHHMRGEGYVHTLGFSHLRAEFERYDKYEKSIAFQNKLKSASSESDMSNRLEIMLYRFANPPQKLDARKRPADINQWISRPYLARQAMESRSAGSLGPERLTDQLVLRLLGR